MAIENSDKISKYSICFPIDDSLSEKYVYINGLTGYFTVIDGNIGSAISLNKTIDEIKTEFCVKDIAIMKKIGHIISETVDEEKQSIFEYNRFHNASCRYIYLTLLISYLCNFDCPYCFERDFKCTKPYLEKKHIDKQTVDIIFNYIDSSISKDGKELKQISLFGGEPLLPSNKSIVDYICKKSLKYDVPIICITNGYYIDQFLDLIRKYPFYDFKITIDGISDIHNMRRSPKNCSDSFDRIIKNVKTLLDLGINVTLRTNINRENFFCINELIKFYEEIGFSQRNNFKYYFKSTINCFEKEDNAINDAEIIAALGNSVDKYSYNSTFYRIFNLFFPIVSQGKDHLKFRVDYCGAYSNGLMVDPRGNIFSCCDIVNDERSVVGTVDNNLNAVIFNNNYNTWTTNPIISVKKCMECKYKFFCGGGCSAQAFIINDTASNPFCDNFVQNFMTVAKEVGKILTSE